jgi:hypothetical protein
MKKEKETKNQKKTVKPENQKKKQKRKTTQKKTPTSTALTGRPSIAPTRAERSSALEHRNCAHAR